MTRKTAHTGLLMLSALCIAAAFGSGNAAKAADQDRFMSRERQLTFDGRRAGEGYFSPDGKYLIYQSERYEGNPFFQIYLMNLETGYSRLLSPGVGRTTCAYIRPDSNDVLFASSHLDPKARETQRKEYEARLDPARGRAPWAYDPHFDIFTCDRRGRNTKRLTDAFGYDAEGAYSPDGKLIVFMSMRDAYPLDKLSPEQRKIWDEQPSYFGEIYIMNADGSNQRRLHDWPGYDGGPFFTPDGRRIIWRHFSDDGMLADIYTMNIDGSDRRRLTDFKSMCWAPFMHPSNEYAIFTSNKLGFANFELFIVDAMGEKEPVRVSYTDWFDGLPVFSPDGKSLCWTTNRTSMDSRKGQLFMADWNHAAALAAVKAAPSRGTTAPYPGYEEQEMTAWPDAPPPAIGPNLTPDITPGDLYRHVSYLASDKLEGRMTGTPGVAKAGDYIAARFQEAGLEALGDRGTFFQEFSFPAGIEVAAKGNQLAIAGVDGKPFIAKLETDYRPLSFASNDVARGGVVCAGYGIVVPAEPGNPGYDSYEGLDVAGKIVLVLDDVPASLDTDARIRFTHYSSPRYKAMQALKRGAAGFLLVAGPNTAGAGSLVKLGRSDSDAGIVAASINMATAEKLLDGCGRSLAELQTMLDDGKIPEAFKKLEVAAKVHFETRLDRKTGECRNVIGLLPPVGEGPIADQYIMVGAHYDHIGRGDGLGSRAIAGEEGGIHNGADDNASGVSTLLEIADAMAKARRSADGSTQRRGVVFACWSGEELGVTGSTHFSSHAPFPLGQIAAYVNFDMVGRLRDGKLILQATGSSPGWARLVERVNVRQPLGVILQADPYLPTDTHAFYPAGIPVLSLFTGVHDNYNRPADDADTLNYAGMEHVAKFAMHLVKDLADRPDRLVYATTKRAAPKGSSRGRRLYTGTVPDFAAGDVGGMRISGAQGGSPAEKAGLKAGDIIIKMAGHKIASLQDYATVLKALKAEEAVEIVVKRDGKEVPLSITPTVRK